MGEKPSRWGDLSGEQGSVGAVLGAGLRGWGLVAH